LEKQAAILL